MASEEPLLIRIFVQNNTNASSVVNDGPLRGVSQIISHVMTSVTVDVLELELGLRRLSIRFRRPESFRGSVLLSYSQKLVSFLDAFLSEHIVFVTLLDRSDLLLPRRRNDKSRRSTLKFQVFVNNWLEGVIARPEIFA